MLILGQVFPSQKVEKIFSFQLNGSYIIIGSYIRKVLNKELYGTSTLIYQIHF